MLVAFSGDYGGVWIRGLGYARGDIFRGETARPGFDQRQEIVYG